MGMSPASLMCFTLYLAAILAHRAESPEPEGASIKAADPDGIRGRIRIQGIGIRVPDQRGRVRVPVPDGASATRSLLCCVYRLGLMLRLQNKSQG